MTAISSTPASQGPGPESRRAFDLAAVASRLGEKWGRFRPRAERHLRAAAGRLAAWARPVTRVVTPLGWMVLAAFVGAATLGWGQGWVEFRTIAVVLAVVAASAAAFLVGHASYETELDLGSSRIRVGEEAIGRVVVRNPRESAARGATIELPVGRGVASFAVPRLAPGAEHEEVFRVPGRRRGVIAIGPVHARRGDPLGLFARQQATSDASELFVHPDTVRLETGAMGFLKDVEGVTTHNLSSSDVSFHALRDYVPGDDRRAVHWRTTARTGRLMVRQFEETMRAHLLLVLSLRTADYPDEASFELAVSTAGSLGLAAVGEGRQVSIVASSGQLVFAAGVGLLDALCRVDADPHAGGLRELAAGATQRVPGASVAALVTGSRVSVADLRAAHLVLPLGVSTFAVRCGTDLTSARRRAAGLTVLDVARLDGLPRAVRTVG